MQSGIKYFSLSIFILFFLQTRSQNTQQEDSLLNKIKTEKNDSLKAEMYLLLSDLHKNTNPDRSYKFANLSLQIARKSKNYTTMLCAMDDIATVFYNKGDLLAAKNKWLQVLSLNKRFGRKLKVSPYLNIATVDISLGNNKEAVNNLFTAMKEAEKGGSPSELLHIYSNVGLVFSNLGDLDQSNYYYNKGFLLLETSPGLSEQVAPLLNNIAFNYLMKKSLDTSEFYFNRALNILEKHPHKILEANIYNNLAEIYFYKKNYKKELELIEQSLKIRKEIDYKDGIVYALTYMGGIYKRNNNESKSLAAYKEAFEIAKEIRSLSHVNRLSAKLYKYYKNKNDAGNQLLYYKEFIASRDSLKRLETIRDANKIHYTFQYQKKIFADSMTYENNKKLQDIEIQNQKAELKAEKTIKYSIIIGLLLVLGLSFFLYNRLTLIKNQNRLIENQKHELLEKNHLLNRQNELIAEKQKEILASIHYAKRIQSALMPSDKMIHKIISGKN